MSTLFRRGITVKVKVTEPGALSLAVRTGEVLAAKNRGDTAPEPRQYMLSRANRKLSSAGDVKVRLRLSRKARRKLQRARRAKRVMLTAQLKTEDGTTSVASRPLRLVRH
jgi:hypothetical protein